MDARDGIVARAGWHGLDQVGRIIGPVPARRVAAAVWRRTATSNDGFTALAKRISPRLRSANPDLFKVPVAWTQRSPMVQVRRLGLDWELDLRDNLQALLYFAGTYEPDLLRFLQAELRRGDVFADIGSHIGVHALTAARRLHDLGAGRVVAFEPTTDTVDKLAALAKRNGLGVEVVRTALGERAGSATIFSDPNYSDADAGVRSQYNTGAKVEQVPLTTFDAWAAISVLDRLDVVKIDVEGAEIDVIRGMGQTLRSLRPRVVVAEVKDHGFARSGGSAGELRQLLGRFGYASTGRVLHHNEVFRPIP